MPEDGAQSSQPQPAAPATVVVSHPLDPGTFCGTDDNDVEDWLVLYERVSKHHRWDATLMLANIIFYLRGTARVWFNTHEEELTSWDVCKEKMRDLFGRTVGRQMAARNELVSRAQTPTESYVAYIQDVLALCRKIDKDMPEADKVAHVLKGIADDAFNILMCKTCSTVDAIITECRRFEQAKSRRITQRFSRLPNTAPTSSCEDPVAPSAFSTPNNLTRIVRQELEAMAPAPYQAPAHDNLATVSLIQEVVRQEFANMGIISPPTISHAPQPMRATVPHVERYATPTVAAASPVPQFPPRYRNPSEWRTPDDRPICFSCHRAGHIARYCRNNWYSRPSFSAYRRQDRRLYSRAPIPDDYPQDHDVPRPSSRSAPTYTDAASQGRWPSRSPSPQGRQSRSPQRRRSPSPAYSGHLSGN